jgi:hypothetical protein
MHSVNHRSKSGQFSPQWDVHSYFVAALYNWSFGPFSGIGCS